MIVQIYNQSYNELKVRIGKIYNYELNSYFDHLIEIRNLASYDFESYKKFYVKNKSNQLFSTHFSAENSSILIIGSLDSINKHFINNRSELTNDFVSGVSDSIKSYLNYGYQIFKLNNTLLHFKKPQIMGILNVTPDSFSDGGKYYKTENAVNHALQMIDDGAAIIDVGGESTRPGSESVELKDELERTIPVIKKIFELRKDCIISIDTTKSEVARQALDNGASILNDISGLTFEPNIVQVTKEFDAAMIIMHIKGKPKDMQNNPVYVDVVSEVYDFLHRQKEIALSTGNEKIIIDPGIGFGKRLEDNISLIKNLNSFISLRSPIMIGLSRKSFIGKLLNLEVDERDNWTTLLEAISIINSARIIRTHNVKNAAQMLKLTHNLI